MRPYWPVEHILSLVAGLGISQGSSLTIASEPEQSWGTVKGQVIWDGDEVPARERDVVDKDKEHCLEKGPILSEKWVVHPENKGIRWVFVWLTPDSADRQKKLPIHTSLREVKEKQVSIDQPCCAFVPHALAIREGQDLLVKNSSPVSHDVRWAGSPLVNPGNDVLIAARGTYTIKELRKDRMPILVSCSIHFWMKAYVRVFDHPYFAITDSDGKFEIKLVPAGYARLVVWHEKAGFLGGMEGRNGKQITIRGGVTTDLEKLPLKE